MKSILLIKKFLGLVEMKSGLVNAKFSLPEWQAVKMIFFAPWLEWQNNNSARASCFFVHFFTVVTRLQLETS